MAAPRTPSAATGAATRPARRVSIGLGVAAAPQTVTGVTHARRNAKEGNILLALVRAHLTPPARHAATPAAQGVSIARGAVEARKTGTAVANAQRNVKQDNIYTVSVGALPITVAAGAATPAVRRANFGLGVAAAPKTVTAVTRVQSVRKVNTRTVSVVALPTTVVAGAATPAALRVSFAVGVVAAPQTGTAVTYAQRNVKENNILPASVGAHLTPPAGGAATRPARRVSIGLGVVAAPKTATAVTNAQLVVQQAATGLVTAVARPTTVAKGVPTGRPRSFRRAATPSLASPVISPTKESACRAMRGVSVPTAADATRGIA